MCQNKAQSCHEMLHWGRPRCYLILVRKDCKLSLHRQERFARGKKVSTGAGAGRGHSSRDREHLKGEQESGQQGELSVSRRAAVRLQGGLGQKSEGTSQAKFKTPEFIQSALGTCLWAFCGGGRYFHEVINQCLPSGSPDSLRTCFRWDGLCHPGLLHDTPLKSGHIMKHQDLILPASPKFLLSLSCTCHTTNTRFSLSQH